jgi:hypothetical protein
MLLPFGTKYSWTSAVRVFEVLPTISESGCLFSQLSIRLAKNEQPTELGVTSAWAHSEMQAPKLHTSPAPQSTGGS